MDWTTEIHAKGAAPPGFAVFSIVVANVVLVACAIVALRRMQRRKALAAAAEASAAGAPPALVEGAEVVLSGIVRLLEGRDVAVRVCVFQRGTEAAVRSPDGRRALSPEACRSCGTASRTSRGPRRASARRWSSRTSWPAGPAR